MMNEHEVSSKFRCNEHLKEVNPNKFEITNIGKLRFVILYVRLDGFDVTNDISMANTCSVTCKLLQQDAPPTYTSLVKPKYI